MGLTDDELKARMMAEAEAAIDRLAAGAQEACRGNHTDGHRATGAGGEGRSWRETDGSSGGRGYHRWDSQRRHDLFKGNIHLITRPLDQADLEDHPHYFHTHKRRMQCQEFREEGYPIGSGTVESSIKQIKGRLTGPGMRWSRPGAERMLVIRSAVPGETFNALWTAAA